MIPLPKNEFSNSSYRPWNTLHLRSLRLGRQSVGVALCNSATRSLKRLRAGRLLNPQPCPTRGLKSPPASQSNSGQVPDPETQTGAYVCSFSGVAVVDLSIDL